MIFFLTIHIWSIPACAGEPLLLCILLRFEKVYPRVCGGTFLSPVCVSSLIGLSPRVRGNPSTSSACDIGSRSIPACAGEPCDCSIPMYCLSVYPRVCGGTADADHSASAAMGLSPRVRGNPRENE